MEAIICVRLTETIRTGYFVSCLEIREAVDKAVKDCIRDDILKEYLSSHKSEVVGMLLTEFDEKKYQEYLIREAREEDRKTIVKAIKTMYTFGIPADVIDKLQMTEEEVARIIKTE